MNIGFITEALPYVPSSGGFRLYAANLIRCLSRRHSIHLVSVLRDQDAEHLDWPRQYCESVTTVSLRQHGYIARATNIASGFIRGRLLTGRAPLLRAISQSLSAGKWELVHVEGRAVGSMLGDSVNLPKVLSIHDSGTLRCAEMLKCALSRSEQLYYRYLSYYEPRFERLVFPRYDATTVVAQGDLEEVRRVVPNVDVRLISNGTDTEYFKSVQIPRQPLTLVFHSHLGYAPNVGAALEFADEIFPRIRECIPNACFHLVGAKPVPKLLELASRPGIRVSADVDDIRPEVCSASVYVCPIRHGTGVKNKVLEAMAMRMPIVSYPAAISGLGCAHGTHVMVARTIDEFVRFTIDLLEKPQLAEEIATQARRFVEEKFSWQSRANAYERLYRDLIEQRG